MWVCCGSVGRRIVDRVERSVWRIGGRPVRLGVLRLGEEGEVEGKWEEGEEARPKSITWLMLLGRK